MKRTIIPYNPKLKELARKLRNDSTRSEIKLWEFLKGKNLSGFKFTRQKPLDNYIADFYSYELALVIELDGITHQFEDVQKKDKIKQEKLESLGLKVLRFQDDEVINDIDNVLRVIEKYIYQFELNNKEHTPNPSQEGNVPD